MFIKTALENGMIWTKVINFCSQLKYGVIVLYCIRVMLNANVKR